MSKLSISITFALGLALAACGGKKSSSDTTTPSQTTPADGSGAAGSTTPMAAEECVAKGGQVKGDIGDGKVACGEGEQDLGRVNQGIEGAVCCAPATPGGAGGAP
jgi:hypothetical protein